MDGERAAEALLRNRMRELRTYGSLGGRVGNRRLYPAVDCLQRPLRFRFRPRLTPRALGGQGESVVPFEAISADIVCEVLAKTGLEFNVRSTSKHVMSGGWPVFLGTGWPGSPPRRRGCGACRPSAVCCGSLKTAARFGLRAWCSRARTARSTSG